MATKRKDLRATVEAATAKLFSEAPAGADSLFNALATETAQADKKAPEKAQRAVKKALKVFSFRADEERVAAWRLYAVCHGMKVDDLGAAAMEEYIKRHALKGAEKDLFDQRIQEIKNS